VLTLTPVAAEAVKQIVSSGPVPEDGGVRIAPGGTTADGTELQISLVEQPETADEAVEENGAHVYLEPTVAQFLDDKVLDAEVQEGQVNFAIREQAGGESSLNGRG
jgi:Fe-S cluster assembly iron-binding protein IscA